MSIEPETINDSVKTAFARGRIIQFDQSNEVVKIRATDPLGTQESITMQIDEIRTAAINGGIDPESISPVFLMDCLLTHLIAKLMQKADDAQKFTLHEKPEDSENAGN
tara:strand:- start:373 stop:696 length:324 start_codon:yes stop_codon:yes gene_type:complete